jgi:hypothetical protein
VQSLEATRAVTQQVGKMAFENLGEMNSSEEPGEVQPQVVDSL